MGEVVRNVTIASGGLAATAAAPRPDELNNSKSNQGSQTHFSSLLSRAMRQAHERYFVISPESSLHAFSPSSETIATKW
jgi:hypothetical protein